MLRTVRGIYRQGQIRLLDQIPEVEVAEVIVTFLPPSPGTVYLRDQGITVEQAKELRQRLATFADDWDAPGMEAYDDL